MEKQIGRLQIEPEDNKMDETPPAKRSRLELVKEMLSNAPKVPGRIHWFVYG